ncbi:MAG: prepilin-type N-terminal cleavage/methylation domain-containing protein [Terrimicrobiaceae bacterium]
MKRLRGFSLVELLATVAITGLLATVVTATAGRGIEAANAAKCLGQLRQWGSALQNYVQDNGGFLPRRGQGVQPVWVVDRPEDWFNSLSPYLEVPPYSDLYAANKAPGPGARSIFVCPSAKVTNPYKHFITYGMNMYLSRWDAAQATRVAVIMGWKDGAAALKRIAETRRRFVDAKGAGKRIIAEKLWAKAGIRPTGDWLLADQSSSPAELLDFAEKNNAYVLTGRIPVLFGKLPKGGMTIAVQGDPDMQRPYVVIEADPQKFPNTRTAPARLLGEYLTGPQGQNFLRDFAGSQPDGIPLFFPIQSTPQ